MSPCMACCYIIIGSSTSLKGNPLYKIYSFSFLLTVDTSRIAICQSSRRPLGSCSRSESLEAPQGRCSPEFHSWWWYGTVTAGAALSRTQSRSSWCFLHGQSSCSQALCLGKWRCIAEASQGHKESERSRISPKIFCHLCQVACSFGFESPSIGLGQEGTRRWNWHFRDQKKSTLI